MSYALQLAKDFAVTQGYYNFQVLRIVESTLQLARQNDSLQSAGWFAEHITGCFTFNALIHSLRALHLYKELLAVYVLGNRILPPKLFAELLSDTKALSGRPERRHWAGYPRFTRETGAQREEGTCLGYMVRWGQRWFPGSSLSRAVPLPDPA